jgi:hypothetical protein
VLRHVAVFRWVEGTSSDAVEAFAAGLSSLPGLIPEIRGYSFGPDAGLGVSANADFAVVADFDDAAGYATYAAHPAHQDVIVRLLRPIVAERLSVQIPVAVPVATGGPRPGGG